MFHGAWRNVALTLGLLAAFALVFGSALPGKALAEEPSLRLISVTGEAEVQVKPDVAVMTFGVEITAGTAQDAQRQNAEKMSAVVNSLLANGIGSSDIQTSNFRLNPVYEWVDEKPVGKQVLVGYRCTNQVSVRVKNLAKIGQVLDAAIAAGANTVGGISFSLLNPENVKNEMLAEAVKNAKAKAEIMAGAAGVTITGINRIADGYASVQDVVAVKAMYDEARGSTPIESGTVTVRASVRVDYTF